MRLQFKCFTTINSFNSYDNLMNYYYLNFTHKEMEGQSY